MKMSYAFRTEVGGRLNKGIPMIKLSYPGDEQLIKIQRREFVRVESAIDIAVEKDGRFTQFVAADLSAAESRSLILNPDTFKEDELLSLTIVLPFMNNEIKYVKAGARVIRVWEKDGRLIASLQFETINQIERQYVIRFCFEQQLQMRNEK